MNLLIPHKILQAPSLPPPAPSYDSKNLDLSSKCYFKHLFSFKIQSLGKLLSIKLSSVSISVEEFFNYVK